MQDMIPKGFELVGGFQVWNDIKHTTINIMMLKAK